MTKVQFPVPESAPQLAMKVVRCNKWVRLIMAKALLHNFLFRYMNCPNRDWRYAATRCASQIFSFQPGPKKIEVPYESPILGHFLDLISPPKINISEPRFELYDPWDMAN